MDGARYCRLTASGILLCLALAVCAGLSLLRTARAERVYGHHEKKTVNRFHGARLFRIEEWSPRWSKDTSTPVNQADHVKQCRPSVKALRL
jgi:hypothetical protein